jgi:hypothetical protein
MLPQQIYQSYPTPYEPLVPLPKRTEKQEYSLLLVPE